MTRYGATLRQKPFGRIWLGATVSIFGDSMTSIALVWLVFHRTHRASSVGWLEFAYGAPVIVGGMCTGGLFRRFGVARTMRRDTLIRAGFVGLVPVSVLAGGTPLWLPYLVAATYGAAKMIPLAGLPMLIGELVPAELRDSANAAEAVSYGIASVAGPLVAAGVIAAFGPSWVLALDALSFLVFAASLTGSYEIRSSPEASESVTLLDAVRFVLRRGPVRAITMMFSAFNAGFAVVLVLLPVYSVRVLHGGTTTYGLLSAALAAGELAGAGVAGLVDWRWPLGRSVATAQTLSGLILLGLLARPGLALTLLILILAGLFEGPLTVWAQTLRMAVIPAQLRGHVFSVLRTTMQAFSPVGAIAGGLLITTGIPVAVVLSSATISGAGVAGLYNADLRAAQGRDG